MHQTPNITTPTHPHHSLLLWLVILSLPLLILSGCRQDERIADDMDQEIAPPNSKIGSIKGFYHLNEGNMGSNLASLDYYDYAQGLWRRDIFAQLNPHVVKELGDVGNDLQIYGSKGYALINVSGLVVVFDLASGREVTEIKIPNCRYITFAQGKAYVSSYAGAVGLNPNAVRGFVAEIDTTTLELTGRKATVGYQPEQMAIVGNKLFVANSGGYRAPNYDHTLSVVDLSTMQETRQIDIAPNLHRVLADTRGNLWISSRGDYSSTPSRLYVVDGRTESIKHRLDIPVNDMALVGDSLYYFSVEYSAGSGNRVHYSILDTRTQRPLRGHLITDGTENQILIPYGIAVHPETHDFIIADAQNYIVTGKLYCYSAEGKLQHTLVAGNIPGHVAFTPIALRPGTGHNTTQPITPIAPEIVNKASHISKVIDYRPAPGQWVNKLPAWSKGDTQDDMNRKVLAAIGIHGSGEPITLGGYGGYVVVGFDQPIENVPGARDLRVLGNAFASGTEQGTSKALGSSEPGIVMVAYDTNGNGLPDDNEWYELAGSEYHKSSTLHHYTITYYRPQAHQAKPDAEESYIIDKDYIAWQASTGDKGYIPQIEYHRQSYYPEWVTSSKMTFTGARLAPNAFVNQNLWTAYVLGWGYADNDSNDSPGAELDIDWAVDGTGKSVKLPRIHFVKIYTATQQQMGALGESSTEIVGILDLHR